jgi:hypothetical protein
MPKRAHNFLMYPNGCDRDHTPSLSRTVQLVSLAAPENGLPAHRNDEVLDILVPDSPKQHSRRVFGDINAGYNGMRLLQTKQPVYLGMQRWLYLRPQR